MRNRNNHDGRKSGMGSTGYIRATTTSRCPNHVMEGHHPQHVFSHSTSKPWYIPRWYVNILFEVQGRWQPADIYYTYEQLFEVQERRQPADVYI